jgi:signal transduction histidine kinase
MRTARVDAKVSDSQSRNQPRFHCPLTDRQAPAHGQLVKLNRINRETSRILIVAAHELKNPLSGILSASEYLVRDIDTLDPDQIRLLESIVSSSQFMLGLVNDLLQVSGLEPGGAKLNLEPTDLLSLLRQTLTMNRLLAEKNQIALELIVDGPVPCLHVDRLKIERMLDNLIANAIKFSEFGASIQTRIGARGNVMNISIQDTPRGFSEAKRRTLFNSDSRAKISPASRINRNGLGLSIVKKIVECHRGKVQLECGAGKGSTFTVTLPLSESAKAATCNSD